VAFDFGTFGGEQSFATAISNDDEVVGYADTADGYFIAFAWTPAAGGMDLGTLPGGYASYATAVNDNGEVVGYSYTASGQEHAFSWTPGGGMVDLGTLVGANGDSYAYGVNNEGEVVGASEASTGWSNAFSWAQTGGMVDLGSPDGANSSAYGVNDAGDVVGSSTTLSDGEDAELWVPTGGVINLGSLGGGASLATAINDNGEVVGNFQTASGAWHAFSWAQTGGMVDLGAAMPEAMAVNDFGEVVGSAGLWLPNGDIVALPSLGGTSSEPLGIDENGDIVGWSSTADGADHAVLWLAAVAPSVASACPSTASVGTFYSCTITTTGIPVPSLTQSGALPVGLTFVDNGDGTATLSGTPAAGTAGVYPITITASNGFPPDAGQDLTLSVA
jgi:probable HAF family extracellular repeat protein